LVYDRNGAISEEVYALCPSVAAMKNSSGFEFAVGKLISLS
jgi:hypothetical protein